MSHQQSFSYVGTGLPGLNVYTLSQYPDMNSSIKIEVGIEDCLHIEFEYNKSK